MLARIPAGNKWCDMATALETIEIDRETAELLRAEAQARGISLDAYLRTFTSRQDDRRLLDFDQWLDELAETPPADTSLAADFSRKNIYADHD
jgi:hypothetical protein